MHFLNKTLGFLAVFSGIPVSYAVTARPSVMGNVGARMPSITAAVRSAGTTNTYTLSSSLDKSKCIDSYTACIKGADACGSKFEDCTTNVLFHAKMSQCIGVLSQCSADGVNALFGASSTTALSNVALTDSTTGEITKYTYPTDGSILGQMIIGAEIDNRYNLSDCVRRYTSCLQRDDVCGSDFELCTTNEEFKKQKILCASTLARCQADGKMELFGSVDTINNPMADSRIGIMITEGARLASTNAVSTCYKVADRCILNACSTNPYRCNAGSSLTVASFVDAIEAAEKEEDGTSAGTPANTNGNGGDDGATSGSDVRKFVKAACIETIGANEYCYATTNKGNFPSTSELRSQENWEDVFADVYGSRMGVVAPKIVDMIAEYDTKRKNKCVETIKSCAMIACGNGVGAACYQEVFGSNGVGSIANANTWQKIKSRCSAVVNTDPNCVYANASIQSAAGTGYEYSFANKVFDTLFPQVGTSAVGIAEDPIGAVGTLNNLLASSYNDAAIAKTRKQCQTVAASCVRAMCGDDYQNCYRNRTDVYSNLTNTSPKDSLTADVPGAMTSYTISGSNMSAYDRSMNKVGGVLDYTVVLGLCLDTVKNSDACTETLAISANKLATNDKENAWGNASTVRGGWLDAGSATKVVGEGQIQAEDEDGNKQCTVKNGIERGKCNTLDSNGRVYDQPVYVGYEAYFQEQAANSLFKDVIYDLEKEAQAKYNAKLTREQNLCLAANNGGLLGYKDMGSTFMWVKLNKKNVPNDYATKGLSTSDFKASNDLYGSFCRIRVTLQSDDRAIQNAINGTKIGLTEYQNKSGAGWATAYFAAGDAFTCGSWIPNTALEKLAKNVAEEQTGTDESGKLKKGQSWAVAGLTLLGGGAGAGITDVLQTQTGLGGLLKTVDNSKNKDAQQYNKKQSACKQEVEGKITEMQTLLEDVSKDKKGSLLKVGEFYGVDGSKTEDKKIFVAASAASAASDDIKKYIEELAGFLTTGCQAGKEYKMQTSAGWSDGVVGRSVMDTIGAVTGGTLAGVGSYQIMKSVNRTKYTEAQQEWMDNIGSKIRCFIGGEEVGTYGDIISTSLE